MSDPRELAALSKAISAKYAADVRELAAVVREALEGYAERGSPGDPFYDAAVALDALVAECEQRGEDRAQVTVWQKQAEARAEAAERERDELFEVAQGQTALVNAAEARARRYEELLREKIDSGPELNERVLANYPESWDYRARAALTEEQNTGVDKDGHAHYEPRWNLREIELWMAALGFAPEQKQALVSALTSKEENTQ